MKTIVRTTAGAIPAMARVLTGVALAGMIGAGMIGAGMIGAGMIGAAVAAPPEIATPVAATSTDSALARTLSLRDGVTCQSLGAPTPELRDALLSLADPALLPPAVPVRAAACLLEQFPADPAVLAAANAWVQTTGSAGLGLVVISRLSLLSPEAQQSLAAAALQMPDPAWKARFQSRLLNSGLPAVVGLVEAQQVQEKGK